MKRDEKKKKKTQILRIGRSCKVALSLFSAQRDKNVVKIEK